MSKIKQVSTKVVYQNNWMTVRFEVSDNNLDREEQDLVSAAVKIHEFESMILSGIIKDATSVNAYNLAKMKGLLGS